MVPTLRLSRSMTGQAALAHSFVVRGRRSPAQRSHTPRALVVRLSLPRAQNTPNGADQPALPSA
jgi:hypothetical protein